jgi:type II secretory pathway pseudopilin PulG
MWIVAIAWMYVALMMALAEATSTQGSILGAVITFLMYGVGPLALVLYLMGAPARRRARRAAEEAEWRAQQAAEALAKDGQTGTPDAGGEGSTQADAGRLTPGDGLATERKEP